MLHAELLPDGLGEVGGEVGLVEDDDDALPGDVHLPEEPDALGELDAEGEKGVGDLQEEDHQVGAPHVLHVQLEALDEAGVEVDDEADGVDEQEGGLVVHVAALVLAAQGREGAVADGLGVAGQRVEEARLPGVVVAGDADRGVSQPSPLPYPLALLLGEGLDLPPYPGLAPGELPELAVERVLAHAPEEGAVVVVAEARLQLEVGSQLVEAGGLDLELAQVVRGHLVEDLQGDLVPVDDVDAYGPDEVELLAAPDDVVEDDEVNVVPPDEAADLLHLAAAHVELGEGAVPALDYFAHHLDAQGLDEAPQLVQLEAVDLVVVDVGLQHTEDRFARDLSLHTI